MNIDSTGKRLAMEGCGFWDSLTVAYFKEHFRGISKENDILDYTVNQKERIMRDVNIPLFK